MPFLSQHPDPASAGWSDSYSMTELRQLPKHRRSGKVIQMSLALKDRPSDTAADLASILQSHQPQLADSERTIHVSGEAAEQLRSLEAVTGQPAETVLAMSLGLLETLVSANQQGRQMMLVSRFGLPLRRVVLPS